MKMLQYHFIYIALLLVIFFVFFATWQGAPTSKVSDLEEGVVFLSDRRFLRYFNLDLSIFIIDHQDNLVRIFSEDIILLPYPVAWSPDGQRMAVVGVKDNQSCIFIISSSSQTTCLIEGGYAPSWSPNGIWLSFSTRSNKGDGRELHIVEINTQKIIMSVPGTIDTNFSSWSMDSQLIVYSTVGEQGENEIWLTSVNHNEKRFVVVGNYPVWSPVRNEIAFVKENDLWIYDLLTDHQELLVDGQNWIMSPSWSPSGDSLLFESGSDGNSEIYRVNRDSKVLQNLTNFSGDDMAPSWKPKP